MHVWCFLDSILKQFFSSNFGIEFLTPERHGPMYSLLISKILARYCHYCRNELVEYNYLLGQLNSLNLNYMRGNIFSLIDFQSL